MLRIPALLALVALLTACGDSSFTMYRSDPKDPKVREYVATFDASAGEKHNQTECDLASTLLTMQRTSQRRYWCEKGKKK
jgi:hypothetical protein